MRRYPRCTIVHLNWLLLTASTWHRQNETDFVLQEPETDLDSFPLPTALNSRAMLSSSSEDEMDSEDEDEALSLPSASVENVRRLLDSADENNDDTHDEIEDVDIGGFDWGEADKEVNEFLAELDEEGSYTADESDV